MVCGFSERHSVFPGLMEGFGGTGRGGAPSPPGLEGGRWRICRGRPACRPVGGSRAEAFPGGHIGPPLRGEGGVRTPTEIWCETGPCQRGGTEPAPYGGAEQGGASRTAGRGHPALRVQHRWCLAAGRCGHRPLRIEGEVSATTRASGAQRSVCAAGAKKWVGIATEVTPKGASNAGQSLSHGCAVPAPFTQGSLDLRGTGVRAAESSAPMESPSQPARSEASAPAAARDGRESTQEPSPKGTAPATTPAALSEAESAEIAAGQIRSLPDK